MLAEIEQFTETGPSAAELTQTQRNITGGFPLRIDSNSKIVNYLTVIGFYGMPLDHLQKFNKRVEAVTVESIRTAWQNRIQPQHLVIVTVGKPLEAAAAAAAN
jgi:zinc protease